jgi:hypothetical protein
MSGDVVTTIKEHAWILAVISLMLSTLSAYFGSGWGRRGIAWTFALGRTRGLAHLKKRRASWQQLHDSDRTYYGWLLTGVLWVLTLLGMQLALEGFMAPVITWPPEQQHVQHVSLNIVRFGIGIAAYMIAVSRLFDNWSLRRRFERNMADLDRAIATLEAKQAAHQRATEA